MMKADALGLYVHIPLCIRKCNYCDFCSFPVADALWREDYINALCAEIDSYADRNPAVDTVFFGGGTPSLLSASEFDKICSHIRDSFDVSEKAEFTVEMNPGTVSAENLKSYISAGVNRVSLGVQSIHENELKILGRIHNTKDFLECFDLIHRYGVSNINLDLMYGIPEQTKESFDKTLDTVLSISPEHLSLYGLILEEGTPFFEKMESLPLPTEDEECDMYYLAVEKLGRAGYLHYEISNYAKPGYECRHNLKYWRDESYVGIGAGAYSYLDGKRFGNSSIMSVYLSSEREKYIRKEKPLNKEDEAYEYVMLGLRLSEGISLSEYKRKFDRDFLTEDRLRLVREYSELGFMMLDNEKLRLTDKGFYISNRILTDLL